MQSCYNRIQAKGGNAVFKVVAGRKLYEQVVEQIKSMIAQGVYLKGDMLPSEKELIESTGVSRITIREALRQLSEAGVIETRRGKGSYVLIDATELGRREDKRFAEYRARFRQAGEVRLLMEPEAARQAALKASDEDIAEIGRCLRSRQAEELEETGEFHRAIIRVLDNPFLEEMLERVVSAERDAPILALVPPNRQRSVQQLLERQHEKIFRAIKSRRAECAYCYMREHTLFRQRQYEEYFRYFD